MLFQELPDRITPMPTCSINIQPYRVATKFRTQVLQNLEEALSVATFSLDYSCATQKRRHPAGNIQSLLMLTGRRNPQPFPDERPTTAKPRMKRKAAFVLKNNGFLRTQRFEFFLGSWRTSSRLLPLPGDIHDWPALTDTQVDASNTGPDGLSALSRTAAVNGPPGWDHPTGHDSNQTSGAIPPDGVPIGLRSSASYGPDAPSAFSGSGRLPHPCLLLASSGLCSSGSGQGPQKSSQDVGPPKPKGGWRSLRQSKLQGFSRPEPTAVLLKLYQGSRGRYSYLPV